MMEKLKNDEHPSFGALRTLIYVITQDKARSPVAEGEVEEIVRCALRGGYKLDVDAFSAAFGRFKLGLDGIDGVA